IYPVGYGIKAFDLGGHGRALPLTISNADDVNLTAYAVRGAGKLFVTLINKKHGPGARDAAVTIVADGIARRAQMIVLAAPDDDVAAKTGVTLGGGIIGDDGLWRGKWKTIQANRRGRCILEMPAATAAVLKLDTSRFSRRQRRGPVKRAGHRRQKRIAGTSSANHKSDGTRRWISSFPHQPKT
ncbi:MAG: hypothetical protein KGR98_13065, partial [Verrucomicrobia bacterium]|nr:hypothetical protein [Verrucomicrobiota bacterium]